MVPIPPFIYKKSNQIAVIAFVPLFALVFIFVYNPLNFDAMKQTFLTGRLGMPWNVAYVVSVLALVLIGTAVVSVSRMIMTRYTRIHTLSYLSYIAWVSLEILVMAIIYAIVSVFSTPEISIASSFVRSIYSTVLILLIPYVVCYVSFILQEKSRQLQLIRKQMEEAEEAQQKSHIGIYDENGVLKMAMRRSNFIYARSDDNYVKVFYLSGSNLKSLLVRNNLKNLCRQVNCNDIVRCHRSYAVNMEYAKVLRRESEGFFIETGVDGVEDIPISQMYMSDVVARLV